MCTGMNWKWGVRICSKTISGPQKGVKKKSVVSALSTLTVQLECQFFPAANFPFWLWKLA